MAGAILVLLLALGMTACEDEAEAPPLAGPSGLGLSLQMVAVPDFLNADGISTSTITITAFGPDGKPVSDWPLFAQHDGDGRLYPADGSRGALQTGVSLATDGSGVARLVYRAGTERDLLVTIRCEPYNVDSGFTGEVPRVVVIHQR